MRPESIRWFDRLFLSGMLLELGLGIENIREALRINNAGNMPVLIGISVGRFLVIFAFWVAISIFSSNIAKWIWIALVVIVPVVSVVTAVHPDMILYALFSRQSIIFKILKPLFYVGATIMLFRSDATAWFAGRGEPADLGEVFR